MPMKTLIVYYSFTENNKRLAHHLQRKLHCNLERVETVRKRNGFSVFLDIAFNRKPAIKPLTHELKNYGHVVFLSPVWAGRIAAPLRSLLMSQSSKIGQYSFV